MSVDRHLSVAIIVFSFFSVVAAISFPSLPLEASSSFAAAVAAVAGVFVGSEPVANAELTQDKGDDGVHLVRLRRQEARQVGMGGAGKSFYTGRVLVGQPPQALHVSFDTSSGQIILPTDTCTSLACTEHWPYQPAASSSAVDINADGTLAQGNNDVRDAITIGFSSLDLGDGSVTGQFLADSVCLPSAQPTACTAVGLVAATQLSDMPFRAFPADGIVGLGLEGLAISRSFNFMRSLSVQSESNAGQQPLKQQFGLYHGDKFGEVAFGGHNPRRLASALMWTPVTQPKEGYWQVGISSIRVGNATMSICQKVSCRGIIDSGTSRLGVPSDAMTEFEAAFAKEPPHRGEGFGCIGQDLHLELSGGIELTLRAQDYTNGDNCESSISRLDLPESFAGVFVLGEPVLKRYYSVFDSSKEGAEVIGFGLAAEPAAGEESAVAAAEVAEDLQEARERSLGVLRSQLTIIAAMIQAFFMRVVVVMGLVLLGTQLTAGRTFFATIDGILSKQVTKFEMAKFTTLVSASEMPQGDECVICLGSCDDDPAIVAGVPGLRQPHDVVDEKGSSCGCNGKAPRWRRLRCGHHFHETCIFEWLRKSKQCPTCRGHFIAEPSENGQAPLISSEQQAPPISSIQTLLVH